MLSFQVAWLRWYLQRVENYPQTINPLPPTTMLLSMTYLLGMKYFGLWILKSSNYPYVKKLLFEVASSGVPPLEEITFVMMSIQDVNDEQNDDKLQKQVIFYFQELNADPPTQILQSNVITRAVQIMFYSLTAC